MKAFQIFHHTRCSKSNQALAYLIEKGVDQSDIDVVLYFNESMSKQTATELVDLFGDQLDDLIRKPDAKKLGIDIPQKLTKKWVIATLMREPKILQRPIIIKDGKAVIGRPTEAIDSLLS